MLGSIFLGDPKARLRSQTSPPSSPHHPPKISPEVALQLRVQWLEAILLGVNDDKKRSKRAQNKADNDDDDEQVSLTRQAEELQRRLDGIVAESDGLRRFIETCKNRIHKPYSVMSRLSNVAQSTSMPISSHPPLLFRIKTPQRLRPTPLCHQETLKLYSKKWLPILDQQSGTYAISIL